MSDHTPSFPPSADLNLVDYNRRRAAEERLKAENSQDPQRRASHLLIADIFDERDAAANRRPNIEAANGFDV